MSDLFPTTPVPGQFGRKCTLLVAKTSTGEALDLSALRIKFVVKRSDTLTPNCADIRVYNLNLETAHLIKKEFSKVILQAGYESNYGVIFKGNIKQVILGRESQTDTFIDIIAGDGDLAYNFSIVNTTLAKGSTKAMQVVAASAPMAKNGVTPGFTGILPPGALPRGKVMYGAAKDHLRSIANSSGFGCSIQDEQINFVSQKGYLPGIVVTLNSQTGLIGTPQQTNAGVNCKCLLNPKLRINGQVLINESSIELLKINLSVPGTAASIPAPLSSDGIYSILVVEHSGDTRGNDWYSSLVTLNIDVTSNPLNAITVGAGSS